MERRRTQLTPIVWLIAILAAGLFVGCASGPRDPSAGAALRAPEATAVHHAAAGTDQETVATEAQSGTDLNAQWGIEVTSIRLTANGHMIDFRYRVLDAEKSEPLFKRQTKPHLIHQPTGKVLAVPQTAKVGALRNSNTPQAGKIYWMFFGDAGKLVKTGDPVTVVIGDFRAEHLVVE